MNESFFDRGFVDPFLAKRLNPIFLETIGSYWTAISISAETPDNIALAKWNLTRFVFRRLFNFIYAAKAPNFSGKIYFLSNIHSDGIGDFFALLKSARVFIQRNPQTETHVVFRHQLPLPQIESSDYLLQDDHLHDFFEPTDYKILQGVLEGKDILAFEQEFQKLPGGFTEDRLVHFQRLKEIKGSAENLYKDMKESLALVHIALAVNTFDNPDFASKSLYFAEAGNFTGIANYLVRNWFGIGFQVFEEGFFLDANTTKSGWKNEPLYRLLFPASLASKSQLFLGYLTRISHQQLVFIYLAVLHHGKDDRRSIDILLPKILDGVIERLDSSFFVKHGIEKVLLVETDRGLEEQMILDSKKGHGKVVRLIVAFPLAASDFQKLFDLSNSLVGCTGDMSLSDCLARKKIPFYELRKHKAETWEALEGIAEYLSLTVLVEYFRAVKDCGDNDTVKAAERLDAILRKEDFENAWMQLMEFVHRYYHLEEGLLGQVHRMLWHRQFPAIAASENEIIKGFVDGLYNAEESYNLLEKEIN